MESCGCPCVHIYLSVWGDVWDAIGDYRVLFCHIHFSVLILNSYLEWSDGRRHREEYPMEVATSQKQRITNKYSLLHPDTGSASSFGKRPVKFHSY